MPSVLLAAVTVGLVGSAHCAGMCGGLALLVEHGAEGRARIVRRGAYYAGKTTTYAALGAVAGGVGAAALALFQPWQHVLSLMLGAVIIVAGAALLGRQGWLDRKLNGAASPHFRALLTKLVQRRGMRAAFGLGLVNGLLPCGLVVGVLALAAATTSVMNGALVMAAFGASTIPALLATAVLSGRVPIAWRARLVRTGGVLLVLLGLLTMARAVPAFHHLLPHGPAPTEAPLPHAHH